MRRKKKVKQALGFTLFGITAGVGSQALTQIGTTPATHAKTALGKMSSFIPMMGTMTGASWALEAMQGLKPKKKRLRL